MGRHTCLQQQDINPPQIFISSTFEETHKEFRDLLKTELQDINYMPIMSELGNFQYTHSKQAVYDDTIQAVSSSQFYILIIGRRYGFKHPKYNKAITELEYNEARKNNLPILVYIHQKVWDGYKAYNDNAIAEGSHTHWVDDLKVFEFIKMVAEVDANRCEFFRHGREIIRDFHQQVANLFGGYMRFEIKASKWLWSEWRTRNVEKEATEVWVITPNFYWDYQDEEFRSIVYDNVVKRNVKYKYLYKGTQQNKLRIKEMVKDYHSALGDDWENYINFLEIPEDQFFWCTEQILFNPNQSQKELGIIVDIMDERNKFNKYNIELGRDKRIDMRHQFISLWNKYNHNSKWKI